MSENVKANYWTGVALALGMLVRITVMSVEGTGEQWLAMLFACVASLTSWAGVGILLAGFFLEALQ